MLCIWTMKTLSSGPHLSLQWLRLRATYSSKKIIIWATTSQLSKNIQESATDTFGKWRHSRTQKLKVVTLTGVVVATQRTKRKGRLAPAGWLSRTHRSCVYMCHACSVASNLRLAPSRTQTIFAKLVYCIRTSLVDLRRTGHFILVMHSTWIYLRPIHNAKNAATSDLLRDQSPRQLSIHNVHVRLGDQPPSATMVPTLTCGGKKIAFN